MSDPKTTQKVPVLLSAQAARYVSTDTPVADRRIAARGALPLESLELATVLFALLDDPDEQVTEHARESLAALPEAICATLMSGPAHAGLLAHFCQIHANNASLLEKAALNTATDNETVALLAACPHSSVVEIISQNQKRLLASDQIVEALGQNPLTGRSVIARILDHLGPESNAWDDDLLAPDAEVDEEIAAAALVAVLGQEMAPPLAKQLSREGGSGRVDEALSGNLHAAIATMTVIQKIKLARYGGSDARALLVRDRNKVVAAAVIRSPKLKEVEVLAIAKSRSVSDETLRLVSIHREWTKNYGVKHALAANPKTPRIYAIRFLGFLQQRDLRALAKSRNIPSAISAQARRLLQRGDPRS